MGRPAVDGRRKRGEQDGKKEKAELGGRADAGHPAGNGALVGQERQTEDTDPAGGCTAALGGLVPPGGRPSGGGPDTGYRHAGQRGSPDPLLRRSESDGRGPGADHTGGGLPAAGGPGGGVALRL